jgi:hypothetical protein
MAVVSRQTYENKPLDVVYKTRRRLPVNFTRFDRMGIEEEKPRRPPGLFFFVNKSSISNSLNLTYLETILYNVYPDLTHYF